ncbi:MAG: SLATT domain-containing protein [Candidatus Solibacter sp.]
MADSPSRNLGTPDDLTWSCDNVIESLKAVQAHARKVGGDAIGWYDRNVRWKRQASRWFQALALTLAALGGLVPVLAKLFSPLWDWWAKAVPALAVSDPGLLASLLIGLSASLIGMDKAFGLSTAWVRYSLTSASIRKAMLEFEIDWVELMAKAGPTPSAEQALPLIQSAKEFVSLVQGMVLQETKEWVAEFQSNMAQTEKDLKAQLAALQAKVDKVQQTTEAAPKAGTIELTVINADQAVPPEFKATLNLPGAAPVTETVKNAKIWTKTPVAAGMYTITASATIGGKAVSGTVPVTVKAGEKSSVTVTMQ